MVSVYLCDAFNYPLVGGAEARLLRVGPSPFIIDYGTNAEEPHIRSPLIAAGTKIPSYSRSSGSEGRNQPSTRNLAAGTLCGPSAEVRQGSASLADG